MGNLGRGRTTTGAGSLCRYLPGELVPPGRQLLLWLLKQQTGWGYIF